VHYRSGRKEAEAVAADVVAAGGKATLVEGDVAQRGGAERVVDSAIVALGRPDVLINNAGDQITRCPIVDTSDGLYDRQLNTNVRSIFDACRAGVRQFRMQGDGGVIINSVAGRTGGGIGSQLYAGAKAFVATFSRSLAKEAVADRIRVNVVSPGVIATDMQDRVSTPAQIAGAAATNTHGSRRDKRRMRWDVPVFVQRPGQRLRHWASYRGERRPIDALNCAEVPAR
jgi:3-oxoacyl-[acyl-carrier protein] reductase